MYPFRVLGASINVPAASGVAPSVSGASYVLVSNKSNTAWADFMPCASAAGPALPTTGQNPSAPALTDGALTPIAPNGQLLIATPGNVLFWGSLTGGVTVTPVELAV